MKKFKNLVVLVMALTMFLSAGLGSSKVLAAEGNDGNITVTGTTKDKSYSVYRIFDLTYTGEGEDKKVSYTIAKEWEDFFTNGAGTGYITEENTDGKLNPIVVDGKVKYINITDQNIADFAKDAMGNMGNVEKVATQKASGDSVTFSGLKLGYYLVHPEGATENVDTYTSLVSLTSTTPSADVVVKGTYPTVEKKVDKPTADIGETITYTLTSKVPDTTGYGEYTFNMTDKPSKGLTIQEGTVKIVFVENDKIETDVTTDGNIKIEYPTDDEIKTLKITFDMKELQIYVGQEIKVTYDAKLNEYAFVGGENPNTVTLEYSNDPKNEEKPYTTTDDEKVYTAKITIDKFDAKNKDTKLEGAKFKLRKKDTVEYYKSTKEGNKVSNVEWVREEDAETVTTDKNGFAEFVGLAAGTYELIEIEAPKGYNKLKGPVEVVIEATTDEQGVKVTALKNVTKEIENSSGVELPGTGGIGTTIFSVIGGLIILFAVLSLSKSKVKKARN